MRRKDKEVADRDLIDGVIQHSEFCHLACCLDDQPYSIPVSFGYDGQAIYIHTAPAGKKITIFEKNPRVFLSFVSQSKLITNEDEACKWSFAFSSVLAEGEIKEITKLKDKVNALNHIMLHYSGKKWEIPSSSLSGTRVWKIVLDKITGKKSPAPLK